jgi:predicted lipoprotein with Yx(FWY)xxD motif
LAAPSPRRRRGRLRRLVAIAPASAVIALAACGGTSASKPSATATTAATASSTAPSANLTTPANHAASASASSGPPVARRPKAGIQISVRSSQYGRILRDDSDRTIYLFTKDRSIPSTCYGACATAWPPVLTRRAPTAGSGLDAVLLGTTRRRDGTLQATYGGHPLYYYVSDKPGQILCQNAEEFGGTWLVVSPHGTAVR